MDRLDNVASDTYSRRSRQMRSWYLYEQYKSLQENQLEAARQLHDKTSQNILLHREMSEHRQRRKMYSECHSDPSIDFIRHCESRSCVTASINDLFESFCQEQDDEFPNAGVTDATSNRESFLWSQDEKELCTASEQFKDDDSERKCIGSEDSIPLPRLILKDTARQRSEGSSRKNLPDDRESLLEASSGNFADDKGLVIAVPSGNFADDKAVLLSISSGHFTDDGAFLIAASSGNLADDIKQELEYVKRNIVENIHLQLEMKENVQSLEGYTKPQKSKHEENAIKFGSPLSMCVDDKGASDGESVCSLLSHSLSEKSVTNNSNMFALWAKLVSFSYQVVQLNHGNCYCDYSSLLMTAILACDVLRRGITQMCNVLQPYVSPIKFVSSCVSGTSDSSNTIKKAKTKKSMLSQATKKSNKGIKYQRKHMSSRGVNKAYLKSPNTAASGEVTRRTDNIHSIGNSTTKTPLLNEAWHSLSTYPSVTLPSEKCSGTWHEELNSKCSEFNSCYTRVSNPMLKLATYIDSIIQDIGNPNL